MEETSGKAQILIVEDHLILREALAELLSLQPDMTVVGEAGTIAEAVGFLRVKDVDLILLDYDLGAELAFELFEQLPGIGSSTPVLILTAGMSTASQRRLLASGALAIVGKQSGAVELASSIRKALVTPLPARRSTQEPLRQDLTGAPFTVRQLAVARSVLQGMSTKEIAGSLEVTESSVKCTLQQLFAKTGTRSRSQLVRGLLERYPDRVLFRTAVGKSRSEWEHPNGSRLLEPTHAVGAD